jgi:hypothetical protein
MEVAGFGVSLIHDTWSDAIEVIRIESPEKEELFVIGDEQVDLLSFITDEEHVSFYEWFIKAAGVST